MICFIIFFIHLFAVVKVSSVNGAVNEENFKSIVQDLYTPGLFKMMRDPETKTVSHEHLVNFLLNANDVFLTHDWGTDESGRNNHKRVSRICHALQKKGLKCWFDEDEMEGRIHQKMSDGIDSSRLVLIFITERYIDKVAGKGALGAGDNCLYEFDYAYQMKPGKSIAVVMEQRCSSTNTWYGPVGGCLGSSLYQAFWDDKKFNENLESLYGMIMNMIKIPIQQMVAELGITMESKQLHSPSAVSLFNHHTNITTNNTSTSTTNSNNTNANHTTTTNTQLGQTNPTTHRNNIEAAKKAALTSGRDEIYLKELFHWFVDEAKLTEESSHKYANTSLKQGVVSPKELAKFVLSNQLSLRDDFEMSKIDAVKVLEQLKLIPASNKTSTSDKTNNNVKSEKIYRSTTNTNTTTTTTNENNNNNRSFTNKTDNTKVTPATSHITHSLPKPSTTLSSSSEKNSRATTPTPNHTTTTTNTNNNTTNQNKLDLMKIDKNSRNTTPVQSTNNNTHSNTTNNNSNTKIDFAKVEKSLRSTTPLSARTNNYNSNNTNNNHNNYSTTPPAPIGQTKTDHNNKIDNINRTIRSPPEPPHITPNNNNNRSNNNNNNNNNALMAIQNKNIADEKYFKIISDSGSKGTYEAKSTRK